MTEVVDDDNSDTSDGDKSTSDDSQDSNDGANQNEKEKSRSQVVKTQIVTEIVTKEQSADDKATESILIVVVAALCLIIIAMVVVCILKRKRQSGPLVVAVPRDSIRGKNESPDNTSFEDNQKPQYNPKDNLDILSYNTSSKRKNSSRPSSQQSSLRNQGSSHSINNDNHQTSHRMMLSYGNEDGQDEMSATKSVLKPNQIDAVDKQKLDETPNAMAEPISRKAKMSIEGSENTHQPKSIAQTSKFVSGAKAKKHAAAAPPKASTALPAIDTQAAAASKEAAVDFYNQN